MRVFRPSFHMPVFLAAVCYLGLAILGSTCLFGVPVAGSGTHHSGHASEAPHSPLCALACKACSPTALVGFFCALLFLLVVLWAIPSCFFLLNQRGGSTTRSRAPPFRLPSVR